MNWAARLATLSEPKHPNVDSADSADSPKIRSNGTIGTNGIEEFSCNAPQSAAIQNRPNDTNGAIDKGGFHDKRPFADDAEERAAIQAEAVPVRHLRPRTAGQGQPQPGDYCGGCRGQLWWTETEAPKGWRCCCCHPPQHLQAGQFRAVAT